jgi:hypothetical protein
VDNALRVGGIESVRHFYSDVQKPLQLQRMIADQMLQRRAIEKFHHDEGTTLVLSYFMDGADVRMVQGRGGLAFPLEAGQGCWIVGYVIRQKLKRDKAVKVYVLSLVNDTHPAAAQFLGNAVMGNSLPDHFGRGRHGRKS